MSGKLTCSANNCAHNISGLCNAATIKVEGLRAEGSQGTECDTFIKQSDSSAMNSFANVNLGGELRQMFTNETVELSPDIACSAEKCIYNTLSKCSADYVQIQGSRADTSVGTQCETFKER